MIDFNDECPDRPGVTIGEDLADKLVTESARRLRAEIISKKRKERIEALEQLLVCYRIGKQPTEKLHDELERTRVALVGIDAE